jgi:hypothetical protein
MPLAIGIEPSHYAVVSAMITPAFFLTATSSLIATSNARLSRVVDRMRVDIAELQRLDHPVEMRELRWRVDQHRRRSRLVLASVRLLYGAVTSFVGTSMAIAIDSVIGWHIDALPMLLAVLGVLLVLLASLCLGREAKMALTMLEADLDRQLARNEADQGTV